MVAQGRKCHHCSAKLWTTFRFCPYCATVSGPPLPGVEPNRHLKRLPLQKPFTVPSAHAETQTEVEEKPPHGICCHRCGHFIKNSCWRCCRRPASGPKMPHRVECDECGWNVSDSDTSTSASSSSTSSSSSEDERPTKKKKRGVSSPPPPSSASTAESPAANPGREDSRVVHVEYEKDFCASLSDNSDFLTVSERE